MPYQQMYVRVHLLMASFLLKQKTSLLFYPSSIRGRSETYYALQLSLSLCNLYISR